MSGSDNNRRDLFFGDKYKFAPTNRSEIIGLEHILDELDQYIQYLKNFEQANALNVDIDAGIIFYGPPGTGKTLCARYMATQSQARFVDVQHFINQEDELTTKDIEELFSLAREYVEENNTPLLLFWDEIEAYIDSALILSELKSELSGVKGKSKGVFLVAATNHITHIDETLLRSGRIGKKIYFSPPNRENKNKLLEYYVNKYSEYCTDEIDLDSISYAIDADAVPTDIEEAVNSAWRNACMKAIAEGNTKPILTQSILLHSFIRELLGVPDNTTLTKDEFEKLAIYEVGRALVARTLGQPVQLIVLLHTGYDDAYRIEDSSDEICEPIENIKSRVITLCAGRMAHELYGIEPIEQGAGDFDLAGALAQQFVERLNGNLKGVSLKGVSEARQKSSISSGADMGPEKTMESIAGIRHLVDNSEQEAARILQYYKENGVIDKLVSDLADKEYLVQLDLDRHVDPYEYIENHTYKQKERHTGQYL